MKVLYCYRYGILGGVCTQLINRLRVLGDSGRLEAHLLFSRDYGIGRTLDGYPYLYFEPDPARLEQLVREHDFDAAVVIDTPEYLEVLSKMAGLPLVTEVHTTVEQGLKYLEDRRWRTEGYIVPSEYSRRLLADRFGIGRAQPVEVVPNSLDAKLFPRVELETAPPHPVFAWVGKLDPHKNWHGFLQVGACLVERGVDAEFWLVGGETAPPARQAELIDQIERLGLHTRCRWFPRVEYRAMPRVYAAVRASGGMMIVTSQCESFGMSVLEALICGCPVVATRVGALPELAPDREYLRLYDFGSWAVAADMAAAMVPPDEAARVRNVLDADHERLTTNYSCETVATRYLGALTRLVDRASTDGRQRPGTADTPSSPDTAEVTHGASR